MHSGYLGEQGVGIQAMVSPRQDFPGQTVPGGAHEPAGPLLWMNLARFDMESSPATRTEPPSGRRVVPGGSLHAGLGRGLSERRLVAEDPPARIADRSFSDPKTA